MNARSRTAFATTLLLTLVLAAPAYAAWTAVGSAGLTSRIGYWTPTTATVTVDPATINLGRLGVTTASVIKLARPAVMADIVLTSLRLCRETACIPSISAIRTSDGRVMARYGPSDVLGLLGGASGKVEVTLIGALRGYAPGFAGTVTVRVRPAATTAGAEASPAATAEASPAATAEASPAATAEASD